MAKTPTRFINQDDTPATYSTHATKKVVVKGDETGVEFIADTASTGTPTGLGDWRYSTLTTATDPGSGSFKMSDVPTTGTLNLYISDINRGGVDMSTILTALFSTGDYIYLQEAKDSTNAYLYEIGVPVDNTGWWTIPLTFKDNGTTAMVNNDDMSLVHLSKAGGTGDGDVTGPGPTVTTDAVAVYSDTGGLIIKESVVTIADSTGNIAGAGTYNTITIKDWEAASAGTIHTDNYIEGGPGTDTSAIHTGDTDAVPNTMLANMALNTIKGNDAALGDPKDLASDEVTAILDLFSTTTADQGLVPGSSGASSSVYLDATGGWSTPAGSGDVSFGAGVVVDNQITRFHLATGTVIQGGTNMPSIDDSGNIVMVGTNTVDGVNVSSLLDISNMAPDTFAGRYTASTGAPEEMNSSQATSILDTFSTGGTQQGVVVGSEGASTAYLKGDGTWEVHVGGNQHLDWEASVGTIHTDNYIQGGAGTDTTAVHTTSFADDQLVVGTGAGTAGYQTLSNGAVSYNTTTGAFAQAALAGLSDVTGTSGTGSTIVFTGSPTIVTPTIVSFTDATHDHSNAAGGGAIANNSQAPAIISTQVDSGAYIFNATGVPAYLGPGNDGQVLTSAGTGAIPAWEDVGGAGHTIVEESGAGLTQRTKLTFIGDSITATDNLGDDSTDVTISVEGTHVLSTGPVTDGHVLTADGAGAAVWEAAGGGSATPRERAVFTVNAGGITAGTAITATNTTGDALLDYSGATFQTDVEIHLNGRILRNDSSTTGLNDYDVYPHATQQAAGQFYCEFDLLEGDTLQMFLGGGALGDVTSAAVIGDNLIVRGDGAGKGIQNSVVSIADTTGNITGAGTFNGVVVEDLLDISSMAQDTFAGRITASTGAPEELSSAQATSILDEFAKDSSTQGVVPASDNNTTKFLRADGTWIAPTGSGDVTAAATLVEDYLVIGHSDDKGVKTTTLTAQNVTDNNAKITNANHTGDVSGDTVLTIGALKVAEGMIQDDAVTLAKLDAGTPGGIIAFDTTTGNPVDVGAGTLDQVLTTSTVGQPPTWEDVGGAGHTIVEESGAGLTQRTKLTFIGDTVTATDNSGDDSTDVTIHSYGAAQDTICEGNDTRLSDNRTADAIATSGADVTIGTTAPTTGQILAATSSTAATWQDPATRDRAVFTVNAGGITAGTAITATNTTGDTALAYTDGASFQTDVEIHINGNIMRNDSSTTGLNDYDVYPHATQQAAGQFYCEFDLSEGATIQMFKGGAGGASASPSTMVFGSGGRCSGAATGTWYSTIANSPWADGNAASEFGTGADPSTTLGTFAAVTHVVPASGTITRIYTEWTSSATGVDGTSTWYKLVTTNGGTSSTNTELGTGATLSAAATATIYHDDQTGLSASVAAGDKLKWFYNFTTTAAVLFLSTTIYMEFD